jgi:GNAT superfamily N-acetyltransferase
MRHDGGVSDHDQDPASSSRASDGLSTPGAVRHAVRADLNPLAVALADAFADDPMMAWIYPDPGTRLAHVSAFMGAALDIGFPHGHVYAAGANTAAAIWAPPDVDVFDEQAVATFLGLLSEQLGPRAEEVGSGLASIGEQHPHNAPHFYLFVLGTARAVQSRGIGSRMLHEILDRCDRQGLGAYLESSNARNVPFYARHGFEVLTEVKLSEEFVARPMWRDPRS